jgi:hypothetical protein
LGVTPARNLDARPKRLFPLVLSVRAAATTPDLVVARATFLSLAFYLGAANMKNSMKTSLGCVPLITITKAKGSRPAQIYCCGGVFAKAERARMARRNRCRERRPEAQKEKTNKLITRARGAKSGAKRDRAIVAAAGISKEATN